MDDDILSLSDKIIIVVLMLNGNSKHVAHVCTYFWLIRPSNISTIMICQVYYMKAFLSVENSSLISGYGSNRMSKKSCPFLYSGYTLKIGQDFLDIQYSYQLQWALFWFIRCLRLLPHVQEVLSIFYSMKICRDYLDIQYSYIATSILKFKLTLSFHLYDLYIWYIPFISMSIILFSISQIMTHLKSFRLLFGIKIRSHMIMFLFFYFSF